MLIIDKLINHIQLEVMYLSLATRITVTLYRPKKGIEI